MKEAYINAKILDPEKNKEFIGDIVVEKDKIIDIGPNVYKKDKPKSYINVHDCKNLRGVVDMVIKDFNCDCACNLGLSCIRMAAGPHEQVNGNNLIRRMSGVCVR